MGWPLPIIAIGSWFTRCSAVFPAAAPRRRQLVATGQPPVPHQPGHLRRGGRVVATYVFHFVLFGVMATRIGLGQLFLDVASSIAGATPGGAGQGQRVWLGHVRHAVRLVGRQRGDGGSLTIPAMIRWATAQFAGAVEAARRRRARSRRRCSARRRS